MRLVVAAFAALALGEVQIPTTPAILVRTADAPAPPAVVQSVRELADALGTRGFRIAGSVADADAVVEILARRTVNRRLPGFANRAVPVDIMRTQLTTGAETPVISGYS